MTGYAGLVECFSGDSPHETMMNGLRSELIRVSLGFIVYLIYIVFTLYERFGFGVLAAIPLLLIWAGFIGKIFNVNNEK
jgi:hypothetical protein